MRAGGGVSAPDVLQTVDGVEGVREGHAVGKQPHALLELLDRGLGVGAVLAVDRAARESQHVEALLELTDVVAVEVGEAKVEGAVSELVAFVYERRPGSRVDYLAERQAVVEPKARDGGCGRVPIGLLGSLSLVDLVSQRAQALLDVFHGGARRALANRFHTLVPPDVVGTRQHPD